MDSSLLKKAIQLNQTGSRTEAREILTQIVSEEPENLKAWFWLVDTLDTNEERLEVLQQAKTYHADHPHLLRAIKRFEGQASKESEPAVPATANQSSEPEPIPALQELEEPLQEEKAETPSEPELFIEENDIALRYEEEEESEDGLAEENPAPARTEEKELLSNLRDAAKENVKQEVLQEARQEKLSSATRILLVIVSTLILFLIGATWIRYQDRILPNLGTAPTEAGLVALAEPTLTSQPSPTSTTSPEPTTTLEPTPTMLLTEPASGEALTPSATPLMAATITPTPAVLEGLFVPLEGSQFYDMAWSANGTYLALATSSGLYLYDGRSYELFQKITVDPPQPIRSITFSDDESIIAGGFDSSASGEDYVTRAKLWKVFDGAEISSFKYNEARGDVDELALSLDGKILWMNAKYDQIIKWQVSDGILLDVYEFSASAVDYYDVLFAPDRRSFATYSPYDRIRLYDSAIGEQISTLGTEKDATVLAYSPNSQYLASSYADQPYLIIWDIPAEREQRTINTYEQDIQALCFNPFNRIIAAATSGDLIKFYDITNGEELRVISRQIKNVNQMAFSPDDTRLVIRNQTDVQIWGIQNDTLIATFRLIP